MLFEKSFILFDNANISVYNKIGGRLNGYML